MKLKTSLLLLATISFQCFCLALYAEESTTSDTTSTSTTYVAKEYETEALINETIAYGVGTSGATNFFMCSSPTASDPKPISFYVYNVAAITYTAIDLLVDDENKDANKEVANRAYEGTNDEQMNSYLRSRDIADLNQDHAKRKGEYKLAASVAVLAAAVLAHREKTAYETLVQSIPAQVCAPSALAASTAGLEFNTKRCGNLGGAKVVCSKTDERRQVQERAVCKTEAAKLVTEPCSANALSANNLVTKVEETGEIGGNVADFVVGAATGVAVTLVATAITNGDIEKVEGAIYSNVVSNAITNGGLQYLPGTRAILYGVLGAIMGANALANNVASKEFGEEKKYYQSLIDEMEECGDNCQASDSSGGTNETTSTADSTGGSSEVGSNPGSNTENSKDTNTSGDSPDKFTCSLGNDSEWVKTITINDTGKSAEEGFYKDIGEAWRNGSIGRYLSRWDSKNIARVGTAYWQIKIPKTGWYRLDTSYRRSNNRTRDADYAIYANDSIDAIEASSGTPLYSEVVNQYTNDPDRSGEGWEYLTTLCFKEGDIVTINLDGRDDNNSDAANDGVFAFKGLECNSKVCE